MAGSLDDPVAGEGPDRIHVWGVGETDNHVLAGKVGRKLLKLPAHQEIDKFSGKTQYLLHMQFLLYESARIIKSMDRPVKGYYCALSESARVMHSEELNRCAVSEHRYRVQNDFGSGDFFFFFGVGNACLFKWA